MESRIPKQELVRKYPDEPGSNYPHVISKDTVMAKCPKCGRITEIRTCYGCKGLMCYDCLTEHQVGCSQLKKEGERLSAE